MRFTIERIRTLVLVAGALLLVALAVFLATARWKNRFRRIDMPQRLAREIEQESQNFDYTHSFGAHSKFRIHAAKAIQLKNDRIDLRGVEIDIYGANGTEADKIEGEEFDYNMKSGVATAAGPVEMLLRKPPAPAGNGKRAARPHTAEGLARETGQIEVQTSGISFDRTSGVVTTAQRVNFTVMQGSGSAVGASFDSESGYLTLMRAVELTTYRGGDEVQIHARHAEFDRGARLCRMSAARIAYRSGDADAAEARIEFRDDGSAARLEATGGFALTTATGGRLTSPIADMDFDEHNRPRKGHLEGGVTMDSAKPGRTVHGTSPTMDLDFSAQGQLRHAHLERGVRFESEETSAEIVGPPLRTRRNWRSPVADVDFHTVEIAGKTQMEPQAIHGAGGVTIASESRRGNAPAASAKMSADAVTGTFGAGAALQMLVGTGHAELEQTSATGALQKASGDRLAAEFAPAAGAASTKSRSGAQAMGAPGVQSAELDGHVALFEQPAAKPGAQAQPSLRATAGKAVYEDDGEWLHLTGDSRNRPRIVNGGLELSAEKVDVSRESGDAFARGDVKATWTGGAPNGGGNKSGAAERNSVLGGNRPAHAIADEAQLNESTGEAIFRGHARLWQQANSIAGPEIVLDQHLETLTARTASASDPVRAVLLSTGTQGRDDAHGQNGAKHSMPSAIRVRGGEIEYFDAERRAVMHGGVTGAVVAETGIATSTSDTVDLRLIPSGDPGSGQAQVDRMTATGHVVLTAQGRRGTGEQLVYSGATGDYVLTGTAAAPPRMTDSEQDSVTGEALIFHSRDDSVSIEGGGHETRTETTAPKAHTQQH